MKIIFGVVCAIFGTAVFSAPLAEDSQEETKTIKTENIQVDHQRDRRLENNLYTVSPFAAASSNLPLAYAPNPMYQSNFGSLQARYFNSEYGSPDYFRSWYRNEEPYQNSREILRYSDGNLGNMFRSPPLTYGSIRSPVAYNGQVTSRFGSGYGIFPKANVGDCAIPLLFSCTPSIVTGQMVNPDSRDGLDSRESASPLSGYSPCAYREVNNHYPYGLSSHIDQATNQHAGVSSVTNHVQNSKLL